MGELDGTSLPGQMHGNSPAPLAAHVQMGWIKLVSDLRDRRVTRRAVCNASFDSPVPLTFINSQPAFLTPNGLPDSIPPGMIHIANLVAAWECCDQAAFQAECRLEGALDDYCNAIGRAPSRAEISSAKRLRFIANHRLRWILYQARRAQAQTALI